MDSDSEALPKSALHNLVSELRYTDGQQVLGTQDKRRRNETCSRVQNWAQKFCRKVGQFASHDVLCTTSDVFGIVDTSGRVQ